MNERQFSDRPAKKVQWAKTKFQMMRQRPDSTNSARIPAEINALSYSLHSLSLLQ